MNKILIIDDDRELCALIKRSVQAENIEADFCNTGKEGLQKLREQEYQLVVLDVMMPGMDGFETLEEIRKENSLPILMFTSKNDSISKVRGLRAGADDYLVKPFSFAELNARIKALLRRPGTETAVVAPLLACGDLELNYASRRARRGTEEVDLTEKEFRLLEFLMQNQGAALSRQVLLKNVWGRGFETNTNVVDVYVNYLRGKVDRDPARRLIHTVVGIGYMMQAK